MDAYDVLGSDEDRDVFYDYLITNLKLYFDKFEDELDPAAEEPTNQAYQQAVDDQPGAEEASIDLEI